MNSLVGELVGNVDVTIYQDENGEKFFEIHTDTEETFPIIEIIEDYLKLY